MLSAMQVVMLLAPGVLTTPRKRQRWLRETELFLILYPFPEPFRRREGCRMSLTEVCALLTVVISLLALLVTVAKAAFDAGWKISHEKSDKNKED